MTKTFRDLGVHETLCEALEAQGITHPFPIQELTLPLALGGHDLIGQARTGTGKTLAFGLPLLQRLDPSRQVTQALVIVPTRELCLQVYEDLKIGVGLGLTSISVYGGVGYDEQNDALTSGVHVVVGTPGRLLDHLNRGNLDLSNVTQLVLDEADEMLDMGFLPDVERLVEACQGTDRHTMLFSATMPTPIVKLARRYMNHPTFTRADYQEERETAPNVEQHFFQVHRMDKPRLLARILQDEDRGGVYVFVRTKHMADRLVTELEELGTPAIAIHGDLRQATREKNLDRFRDGRATVLVATEVAARGLDVQGVTHVVNYDCPDDEKMYLHRIGRTARAGGSGKAITFAEFNEVDRLNVIRKKVGATDVEVIQVFSTSPVLAERFRLPAERPWDRQVGTTERRDSRPDRTPRGEGGRKGSSDGRPKSGRAQEGRGGDRDADRRQPRSSETRANRTTDPVTSPERSTNTTSRTRQRSRTRTATTQGGDGATVATQAEQTPAATTPAEPGSPHPPRTRARSRGRSTDARERAGSQTRAASPERSGSAQASPRNGGPDASRERGSAQRRGSDGQREGTRNGDRGSRSSDQRSDAGGRRKPTRPTAGNRQRNPATQDHDATVEAVPTTDRGTAARGTGQPQRSRRVRVDHLP